MNIEEMEPSHAEELKKQLLESDTVLDIRMVEYQDMYGDGSRSYLIFMHDQIEKCLVMASFEYYITKKVWLLSDEKIWSEADIGRLNKLTKNRRLP